MEMAVGCTARWPYVGHHVFTVDIFHKSQQVALLLCIRRVPGLNMIRTSNVLTDCGLFVILFSPPMEIFWYSCMTSTKSPSFCVITFSASLTNVTLLLLPSRVHSCYVSRPIPAPPLPWSLIYAHTTSSSIPTCEIILRSANVNLRPKPEILWN